MEAFLFNLACFARRAQLATSARPDARRQNAHAPLRPPPEHMRPESGVPSGVFRVVIRLQVTLPDKPTCGNLQTRFSVYYAE